MARTARTIPTKRSDPNRASLSIPMQRHLTELGLESVEAYREWCRQNHFSTKLDKHFRQLRKEREVAKRDAADARLVRKQKARRSKESIIALICSGRVLSGVVEDPVLSHVAAIVTGHSGQKKLPHNVRRSLRALLERIVATHSKLLDRDEQIAAYHSASGNSYVEPLIRIAVQGARWLRPLDEWTPSSHNTRRQFSSLLRHLFVEYEMPEFFEAAWFAANGSLGDQKRQWFLHVGRGRNLRECDLPLRLSKKMAHHVMRAPGDLSIVSALRWGQVLGSGGDERLARAVVATRLGHSFENETFWETVINWLVHNPIVPAEVGPIIDYLQNQRFEEGVVRGPRGQRQRVAPPQPRLTMRGRTADAMLRQVADWHGRLAETGRIEFRDWPACGIAGFEWADDKADRRKPRYWTIRELLSTRELIDEGRRMRHCVATYDECCVCGDSAIFALEVDTLGGIEKALTIEVDLESREIVQARGKGNREPTERELFVVSKWARWTGLTINRYIRD
ncbi:PcfJ domain-containing protein [Stratiformator vulcanicus]|uniref:PcfJ-like protein n=1 Tax=Stratiformator vulcanicus TaxID=2527980 RepID=A0A517R3K0_9PLAN|nr:PcfJ domain-containing protein [Stratiformator vulcanicus]QDT38468.1 hypothetical protein Pan189_28620 [Stratiformator vulcanicus]